MIVAYLSPAGSTRHVADRIRDGLQSQGEEVAEFDLADTGRRLRALAQVRSAGDRACLFIGSPVYRDQALAPVMRFIYRLPETSRALAVPFVTWGAACSGLALWQMGRALQQRGFSLAAAAKVVAVHSMMWHAEDRPGRGHPNASDDQAVEAMVDVLCRRFQSGGMPFLELEQLDYQPHERADEIRGKMRARRLIVPKKVDRPACTQCGICASECPVSAVSLKPFPAFEANCIDCFNCIRLCPENAIQPRVSLDDIAAMIRKRVRSIRERPLTQVFFPASPTPPGLKIQEKCS
jgi:ferredoxin